MNYISMYEFNNHDGMQHALYFSVSVHVKSRLTNSEIKHLRAPAVKFDNLGHRVFPVIVELSNYKHCEPRKNNNLLAKI